MRIIGAALVIVGIVALVYGGIGYSRDKTVLDIGSMRASVTEHKNIPVSPIVGVLSLVGGVALIVVNKRRA